MAIPAFHMGHQAVFPFYPMAPQPGTPTVMAAAAVRPTDPASGAATDSTGEPDSRLVSPMGLSPATATKPTAAAAAAGGAVYAHPHPHPGQRSMGSSVHSSPLFPPFLGGPPGAPHGIGIPVAYVVPAGMMGAPGEVRQESGVAKKPRPDKAAKEGKEGGEAKKASSKAPILRPVIHPPPPSPPCYCQEERPATPLPMIQCTKCYKMFHQICMDSIKAWKQPPLLGDDFFHFICKDCNKGKERIRRLTLSWSDVAHISLFNLAHTVPPHTGAKDGKLYYHIRNHIAAFVDTFWDRLWLKARPQTWTSSLVSAMASSDRFVSGKEMFPPNGNGYWALANLLAFPSTDEVSRRSRYAAYEVTEHGTLREMQHLTASSKGNATAENGAKQDKGGFGTSSSKKRKLDESLVKKDLANKKGKVTTVKKNGIEKSAVLQSKSSKTNGSTGKPKIIPPRPRAPPSPGPEVDPLNSILIYPDVNNPPPPFIVRISTELTHADPKMKISEDGLTTYTDKGYRTAKSSHGVYEGHWYCEVTYQGEFPARARIGWAQTSGDLQAPCGYDVFGYVGNGDVIGMSIFLPELKEEDKKPLMRRVWIEGSAYERMRIGVPLKRVIGSEIRYYRNGVDLGVAFRDLYLGKYYLALSSYRGGTLKVNFGPDFQHAPPAGARALKELETEYQWMDFISCVRGELEMSEILQPVFEGRDSVFDFQKAKKKANRRVLNFPLASKKKKKKKRPVVPAGGTSEVTTDMKLKEDVKVETANGDGDSHRGDEVQGAVDHGDDMIVDDAGSEVKKLEPQEFEDQPDSPHAENDSNSDDGSAEGNSNDLQETEKQLSELGDNESNADEDFADAAEQGEAGEEESDADDESRDPTMQLEEGDVGEGLDSHDEEEEDLQEMEREDDGNRSEDGSGADDLSLEDQAVAKVARLLAEASRDGVSGDDAPLL
ncbi:transcription factor, contains a PHD finger motif [Phlyctochytrium bullatum]|nr:transcription factor, contains a PHD finger motif [Phlyctochytrium bullatum]